MNIYFYEMTVKSCSITFAILILEQYEKRLNEREFLGDIDTHLSLDLITVRRQIR